ncbi:unnamed protein product [Polarella glacialis]|nr:unnamed protein product [Polarella glacialis]
MLSTAPGLGEVQPRASRVQDRSGWRPLRLGARAEGAEAQLGRGVSAKSGQSRQRRGGAKELLGGLARARRGDAAQALLREMAQQRIEVGVRQYGAAMGAWDSSWQKVLGLAEEMRTRAVEANTITGNSEVNSCARAGRWQQAAAVLAALPRR